MKSSSSNGITLFTRRLLLPFLLTISYTNGAYSETLHFDPAFLSENPAAVAALDQFEQGVVQPPGKYRIDFWLNEQHIDTREVNFVVKGSDLVPCFSVKELDAMGVNTTLLEAFRAPQNASCLPLTEAIKDATADYNVNQQVLKITIPQALIRQSARGYIPPEQWDNGITALLLNYQLTGSSGSGSWSGDDAFLNLQSGLNIGPWRLRDYSTWSYQHDNDSASRNEWSHLSTTISRPIAALRSMLTLGDTYTGGELFNSVSLRGVQMNSDDSMYPDSQRGFAPTIHGIAKSNAQITVRQNSSIIYQTYVPQGAFTIDDLYPTSSSGDLEVTIKEADGTENSFTIPYAAVPLLQREGHVNYNVAVGKYNNSDSQQDEPDIVQAQLFWGLPWNSTLYGGVQWAEHYRAGALGFGFNLGSLGAISLDATHAYSELADESTHQGESYRFLYAKTLEQTNTHLQLAGYRYSTKGFYTLEDTTWRHMTGVRDNFNEDEDRQTVLNSYNLYNNQRSQFQLNISQSFGEYGSIYASANRQDYWNTNDTTKTVQFGYSGAMKYLNYSINYSFSHSDGMSDDRVLSVNFSLPLSQLLADGGPAKNNTWVSYNNNSDNDGRVSNGLTLSGDMLADRNLTYSVQQTVANQGEGYSNNIGMTYRGAKAQGNLGYSYDQDSHRLNYGLQGSLLAHANGITLSQSLGDTNILVKAPGAEGVALENATGIRTDSRGYAVIPWASAYRQNRVALRVADLGDNVEVDNNINYVVPTEGAIVRAEFTPRIGRRALISLVHRGSPIPFGATVTLDNAPGSGIVSDDGQVFLSGLPEQGTLLVQWGKQVSEQCRAPYQLPVDNSKSILQLQVECQ